MRNLILVPLLAITSSTFAANTCVSGNPSASNLIDQMKSARTQSAITKIIYRTYDLDSSIKTEGTVTATGCATCDAEALSEKTKNQAELAEVTTAVEKHSSSTQLSFKKECLISSGNFKSSSAEVLCPSGQKAKGRNLCLTENMLDYQNAVISNFNSCLAENNFKTLDAASLFKLYSLESAFKPQFAYSGGVGAGQLTSIFIEDIHQKHRGYEFLNAIAKSSSKDCAAAQLIAAADVKIKPKLANTCTFTAVGEGLERNILYTLVGLANSWKKDISPKFKSYAEKYKNDPLLQQAENLALLNSYGPGGRVAARAAVERLSGLPPAKFIAAIKKPMSKERGQGLSIYVNHIEDRQKLVGQKLSEPLKSEFAKSGASACVN